MKILLDTHIYLWWLFDDSSLKPGIRKRIANTDNEIFVSAASVWEIVTKYRLGKLPEASNVAKNVPLWIDRAGFKALPINAEHAQLSGSWKVQYRDPFDRMLAAQSKLEKMPLATNDVALRDFDIDLISI